MVHKSKKYVIGIIIGLIFLVSLAVLLISLNKNSKEGPSRFIVSFAIKNIENSRSFKMNVTGMNKINDFAAYYQMIKNIDIENGIIETKSRNSGATEFDEFMTDSKNHYRKNEEGKWLITKSRDKINNPAAQFVYDSVITRLRNIPGILKIDKEEIYSKKDYFVSLSDIAEAEAKDILSKRYEILKDADPVIIEAYNTWWFDKDKSLLLRNRLLIKAKSGADNIHYEEESFFYDYIINEHPIESEIREILT